MRNIRRTTLDEHRSIQALLGLSLFADCSPTDLAGLVADADVFSVPAHTIIDRKGTAARQFVGIVDGYLHGSDSEGRPVVLGPGDHLGARQILTGQPHDVTFEAMTRTTVVTVFGPRFRTEAHLLPGVIQRVYAPLDEGLYRAVSTQNSLSSGSAMTTQLTAP